MATTDEELTSGTGITDPSDLKLRKDLGFWSLLAAGVGSVIGSGWLFSSMYAAQSAGPSAIVSWVIAGALMLLIALVFAELAIVRPESGGLVRYPLYSNGRLAATIVGWCFWISYVGNPPTEAAGTVQYMSAFVPGVWDGEQLTGPGILIAIGLMALFVLLNWFGVRLFARSNNIVTAVKVLIPTATVVLLLASGFDTTNVSGHGGFAPYGAGAPLAAIATAGLVFAYTGFRNIVELSGEAKHPRRHIPLALVLTVVFAAVLYLGLQLAFLGAVPASELAKSGWRGVNFASPFADLALLVGFTWLSWLLIADSVLSPSGSGIVYTGANGRNVYGLGKNRFFPHWFTKINRFGVPGRALALNFVVGIAFLVPLPSWYQIVGVMSTIAVFTFSIGSVSLMVFRRMGVGDDGSRLTGMGVLAPLAFVISSMVVVWVPWSKLAIIGPVMAVSIVLYAILHVVQKHRSTEVRGGLWLPVYLVFVFAVAGLGSFGDLKVIPAPWDTVIAAVGSILFYVWGVRSGIAFLTASPRIVEELRGDGERIDADVEAGRI